VWLEREPSAKPDPEGGEPLDAAADIAADQVAGPASRDLLCATCRARISHDDHRIAVHGSHEHTFVNPGGFVHRLGCFAVATNLSQLGVPETAFAWFPGFSWQVVVCRACRTHLGWIFRCGGDQFTGLLLDQLVSPGGGAQAPPGPAGPA
jgi:hypothetical protein